jgi:hypothetical protein
VPDELYARRGDPEQRRELSNETRELGRLRKLVQERSHFKPATELVPEDAARAERMRELGYVDR